MSSMELIENRVVVVVVAAVVEGCRGVGELLTIQNVVVGFNGGLGLVKVGRRCWLSN